MKNNWEETTLEKVIYFERGLTYPKTKEVSFSKNIVLRSNNITLETNSLNFLELKYISDDFFVPQEKKVKKNTLIICISSGSKIHLGKVAIIDKDYNYAFGSFMGLIIPKNNLSTKFLYYIFNTKKYKNFISKLTDGININNLKWDDFKNFLFYLPPLQQQKEIVKKLDKAFADIDKLTKIAKQNLENSKELFNSYLNKLFTKNNNNWEEIILNDICKKIFAGGDKPVNFSKIENKKYSIPVVANGIENDGLLGFTDVATVIDKAITISARGTIGFVCKRNKPFCPIVRLIVVIPKTDKVILDFLYYLLQTLIPKSNGSSIPQLTIPNFKYSKIKLPPLPQQKQIVKILDNLQEKTKKLEEIYNKKIELAKELKQSVLHKELQPKV